MKLMLCDISPAVVDAWKNQFSRYPDVEVREVSILDVQADALVNPGNSFGFMDGGLDLKIAERFGGFQFEDTVRTALRERFNGEMLVGQAAVFPTGSAPPYMVYAPTMRTPQTIQDTVNVYLAARAAFQAVQAFNAAAGKAPDSPGGPIARIAFPGLGTGTGRMNPLVSARQLRYAYEEAAGLRKKGDQNLSRLARREKKLKEIPVAKDGEE